MLEHLNLSLNDYRRGSAEAGIIPRVLGLANGTRKIIDATFGLGRDSFLFASLGCEVHGIERNREIYQSSLTVLNQGKTDPQLSPIINKINLEFADSLRVLEKRVAEFQPDCIYLDPMVTPLQSKSKVKAPMAILQEHLGSDSDFETLFSLAVRLPVTRIIVKRPLRSPTYGIPSHSWKLRSTRYDLYLSK